jgi:hypothetical protein
MNEMITISVAEAITDFPDVTSGQTVLCIQMTLVVVGLSIVGTNCLLLCWTITAIQLIEM